jgi:hypothetical protein
MPTIANKILHPSLKHILLYKEGVFWVAYEQSAYYIAQYKGYKPTKKYFKNINQTIVSVGFPNIDALLNEIEQNNSIQSIKKTDTTIEILLQKSVNITDVELWKENILQKNQEKPTSKASIEQLVKAFPLANKTPMEAFLFIKELQDS